MTTRSSAEPSTRRMIATFYHANPRRMIVTLSMVLLAGLLEGLSVVTLLPLLGSISGEGTGAETGPLGEIFTSLYAAVGITPTLPILLGIVVVGIFIKSLLTLSALRLSGSAAVDYATELRLKVIRALMLARWSYFVSQRGGRLSNAINQEASQASSSYSSFVSMAATAFQVLVYSVIALFSTWQVTLMGIIAGTVMVYLLKSLVGKARHAGGNQVNIMNNLMNRLVEGLQIIKPLKAMAREDRLQPLLEDDTNALNKAQKNLLYSTIALGVFQEPVVVFFFALSLYGAMSYLSLPFTQILFLAILFQRIVTRIGHLQILYQKMASFEAAFWSLSAVVDQAEMEAERISETGVNPRFDKKITLESLSFDYGGTPVIRSINMTVDAKAMTVIFGPSGSGKSTLADLIIGLHQPSAGRICIDGQEFASLNLKKWRSMIGYVPQDVVLFDDTIMNNVTMRDQQFTREDAVEALQRAEALEFVEKLPQGLDTRTGERGGKLSGGERQRISIARALIRKPAILILDEPTASLDQVSEKEICATLHELTAETCVFAITHRAGLLDVADRVYRLDNGKIVEQPSTGKPITVQTD